MFVINYENNSLYLRNGSSEVQISYSSCSTVTRNLKTREKSDQKTKNTLDNLGKFNIDASNNCYTKLQLTNQNQKAFRKHEQ